MLRLWRRLLMFSSRWWQLESLYRSNVKYQPQWVPRFPCFEDAASWFGSRIASGVAEGFLTCPLRKAAGSDAAHRHPLGRAAGP